MINNSSLDKWIRLQKKDLSHQFINEIIHGLNCSPFEAEAVLDAVYKVFGNYFDVSSRLQPGQILFQVVSSRDGAQVPLSRCQQTTVTLTLDEGTNDLKIKEAEGVSGLRRRRIERICHEAFQQGGLLTVEDLANRLFNCGERTVTRDLSYFRKHSVFIPLRSTVKDMGRTLSHYAPIIKKWLKGSEYSEIARATCHSISAVHNYVDKFKRVVALHQNQFDINTVSFLAKVSESVAKEYLSIYQNSEIIEHRKKDIEGFLKNETFRAPLSGGSHDSNP